jgi:hypothetical protein
LQLLSVTVLDGKYLRPYNLLDSEMQKNYEERRNRRYHSEDLGIDGRIILK